MTNQNVDPAKKLAAWADRLRDISATGAHFARNPYDSENYHNITTIAMEMIALATDDTMERLEPLRSKIFAQSGPISTVDAAVVDDLGRLLLIRRSDNGCWSLPGGILDVGETPAEGAVRETVEETGVQSKPTALVGVFDGRFHDSSAPVQIYQYVFLCHPLNAEHPDDPTHPGETLGHAWFFEGEVPSELDPNHATRIPVVFEFLKSRETFFDK